MKWSGAFRRTRFFAAAEADTRGRAAPFGARPGELFFHGVQEGCDFGDAGGVSGVFAAEISVCGI